MKILVTGAAGTIGSALVRLLAKEKENHVVALFRSTSPECPACVQTLATDLALGHPKVENVDVIIHSAAHTHLEPRSTAQDYVSSNVTAMKNLCDYAAANQVRLLINLSTISVYGRIRDTVLDEESFLFQPDLYGASKYFGELILADYAKQFPAISVRLPGVVGPGYFAPWLGRTFLALTKGDPVTIYNPDAPFNNITDFDELHRFIGHVIHHHKTGYTLINLGASEPISIRSAVDSLKSLTKSRSTIIEGQDGKTSFVIGIDRLKTMGFVPQSTQLLIEKYVSENRTLIA